MKTNGRFTARPERGDLSCYIDVVPSKDEVRITTRYMLPGGPPYKHRESTVIMNAAEAAILTKQLVGALSALVHNK